MNTTEFLYIATSICPHRNFIVFEGEQISYARFNENVNRFANALKKLDVHKGDRIGMLHVNCPQYIEAYFATAKTGAIFVPLNFRAKADELTYMIDNAKAKVLLVGARYLDMVRKILPNLPSIETCISVDAGGTEHPSYQDLMNSSGSEEPAVDIDGDDITLIMYTAGTTGRPKGVPLRHSSFTSYVLENVDPADPEVEERNLLTVPLYHVAGIQAMVTAVYGGRTLVLMRQFEVKEWLKTVQDQRVTRAMLVPTMLKWIIDDPEFEAYDLSSLQVITYGAAPMPLSIIRKAVKAMPGVQFINAFGQTETSSTITVLGPEDHVIDGTPEEQEKKLKRLASSIGKPLPDVQVKIVDDQGNALPPNQVGEIWAKGPRIMRGYWGDEGKSTAVITKDGWLRTGDRGWMDEEGYVYLAGRSDDIIIRGGENISPEEVEEVLCSHPKVEEAAVIGIPDAEWGQEVRAVAVTKKGENVDSDEIIEYCRPRLAGFKRPRSVVFVDSLPRNHMGKVLRKELRAKYGQP
ncbi:MAG: long-chain-fatty-acid--CoA ligase [Deltaproteobacteria bacterium]|nr:long-chain-fatty-acid--CoA ligase [Deltaproteobacteria bacterium]